MNIKFLYLPALAFCFSNASIAMDIDDKGANSTIKISQNIQTPNSEEELYKDYQQVCPNWNLEDEFSLDAYIMVPNSNTSYRGSLSRSFHPFTSFLGKEVINENDNAKQLLLVARTTLQKSELIPTSYSFSDYYDSNLGYVFRRYLDEWETTWTDCGVFPENK